MTAQPPTDTTSSEPWTRSGPSSPATEPYAPPPLLPPPEAPHPTPMPQRPKRRWGPIVGGAVGAIVAVALLVALRSGSDSMPSIDKWTTFSDPGGRFTVSMPKEPERTTQEAPAGTVTLDVIAFTAEYNDGAVVVGYTDYPEDLQLGAPQDVLEGAVEGAAQATEGTVVSSTPTTVAGRPAMDADTQVEQGRALTRWVLDGRRLYVLTTAADGSRSDIQRHLADSFTFTGG